MTIKKTIVDIHNRLSQDNTTPGPSPTPSSGDILCKSIAFANPVGTDPAVSLFKNDMGSWYLDGRNFYINNYLTTSVAIDVKEQLRVGMVPDSEKSKYGYGTITLYGYQKVDNRPQEYNATISIAPSATTGALVTEGIIEVTALKVLNKNISDPKTGRNIVVPGRLEVGKYIIMSDTEIPEDPGRTPYSIHIDPNGVRIHDFKTLDLMDDDGTVTPALTWKTAQDANGNEVDLLDFDDRVIPTWKHETLATREWVSQHPIGDAYLTRVHTTGEDVYGPTAFIPNRDDKGQPIVGSDAIVFVNGVSIRGNNTIPTLPTCIYFDANDENQDVTPATPAGRMTLNSGAIVSEDQPHKYNISAITLNDVSTHGPHDASGTTSGNMQITPYSVIMERNFSMDDRKTLLQLNTIDPSPTKTSQQTFLYGRIAQFNPDKPDELLYEDTVSMSLDRHRKGNKLYPYIDYSRGMKVQNMTQYIESAREYFDIHDNVIIGSSSIRTNILYGMDNDRCEADTNYPKHIAKWILQTSYNQESWRNVGFYLIQSTAPTSSAAINYSFIYALAAKVGGKVLHGTSTAYSNVLSLVEDPLIAKLNLVVINPVRTVYRRKIFKEFDPQQNRERAWLTEGTWLQYEDFTESAIHIQKWSLDNYNLDMNSLETLQTVKRHLQNTDYDDLKEFMLICKETEKQILKENENKH